LVCHGPDATGPDYAQLKQMGGKSMVSSLDRDQREPMSPLVFLVAAMCSVLAACATDGGGDSANATATNDTREPSIEAQPSGAPSNTTNVLAPDLLAEIVSTAAGQAGVETDAVRVVIAEHVTWSDGSIGCPEPGMMYTQALVPGYRVVLDAGGRQLNFHATESGDFRYCENPRPPLERSPNE
jgi:hypothetical protein